MIRPFQSVQVATADNGETAVVWRTRQGAIHATVGTPGSTFAAPITLADGASATTAPSLAMDAAGNVVVVWETYVLGECDKYGSCQPSSLGVFAALRPAGGAFGAPVRVTQAQRGTGAGPQLAMNRAGDWVLAMNVGTTTVVGAGRGATPPTAFSALPMPTLHQFALDETGAATFAGVDGAQRPATVVRNPDGSFVAPQLLDEPSTAGLGVRLGVGPRGDALAVWPAGNELHWASRPAGGSFGAAGSLPASPPSPVAVVAVGVDGTGRTTTVLPSSGPIAAASPLVLLRGTTAAPFGGAVTLTEPGHALVAPPTFALGADGTAAVGWLDGERWSTSVRLSVAFGDGSFSRSLGLGDSTRGDAGLPSLAVDGTGRVVAAWLATANAGESQRVVVTTFHPAGSAGSSIVAQAPLEAMPTPPLPDIAIAPLGQRLRIRADRTVRPQLRCVSASPCRGQLRIDVRVAAGRSIRLGTRRFVLPAGSARTVTVRATLAARRAAQRRSLRATMVVRTTTRGGSPVTSRVSLTIRRTARR